jgi:hypothetical protein
LELLVTEFIHTERLQSRLPVGLNGLRYPKIASGVAARRSMRKSSASSLVIVLENMEKVLERLGTTESTSLALKRKDGGKIRVTSLLWEAPE